MAVRRGAALALAVGALALGAVWVFGAAGPPVYDGLPIGTPPYRYLDAPSGTPRTPAPSSVSFTVVLSANPAGVVVQTKEPIPQAEVALPTQDLVVPSGVTTVHVSLAPVQPPATPPLDGRIDGNVYRLSAVDPTGRPLLLKPTAGPSFAMELRGTGSQREPRVEEYLDGAWMVVPFHHPSSGIFDFNPPQLGEFALVLPPGSDLFGPGLISALVVGGALIAVGGGLYVLRRSRLAGMTPAEESPEDAESAGDEAD